MDEMKISISHKSEIERFILLSIIGLVDSLIVGAISIEKCEEYLFSPYSVDKLNTLKLDERIVELVEMGCELEDVESLIPEKLHKSIDEIRLKAIDLLRNLPIEEVGLKKWID
jgi:hypothetical protein